jgi:MSHA biogenesis protein MshJ
MKQAWEKFALKIDALTLRERVIIFAAAVLLLGILMNVFLLDPQYAQQSKLSQQIKQQQSQIAELQNQIQQRVKSSGEDPNKANLARLQELKQQAESMDSSLENVQRGLVSPDKMATLLEGVLKRNNRLLLVSLKTLPVVDLSTIAAEGSEPAAAAASGAARPVPQAAPSDINVRSVYKHTVELTVQGSYPDMLDYLRSLESMPWQLFWGSAHLSVDAYPTATLTMTVFTLSLDKKWLNL